MGGDIRLGGQLEPTDWWLVPLHATCWGYVSKLLYHPPKLLSFTFNMIMIRVVPWWTDTTFDPKLASLGWPALFLFAAQVLVFEERSRDALITSKETCCVSSATAFSHAMVGVVGMIDCIWALKATVWDVEPVSLAQNISAQWGGSPCGVTLRQEQLP